MANLLSKSIFISKGKGNREKWGNVKKSTRTCFELYAGSLIHIPICLAPKSTEGDFASYENKSSSLLVGEELFVWVSGFQT